MKKIIVSFLSLVGVLITVLAPIGYEWYASKSNITLVKLGEVKILEKKAKIDGLKIYLHDKPINNLSKLSYKLKNTGTKPITKSEIIEPIEIIFDKDVKILDLSLYKTNPKNITARILESNNTIKIIFSLLNPDDELYFSILTDGNKINFSIKSRIKNVKSIKIISIEDGKILKDDISFWVYVIVFFSIIFIIYSLISLFYNAPSSYRQIKLIDDNKILYVGMTKEEFDDYIDTNFSYFDKSRLDKTKSILDKRSLQSTDIDLVKKKLKDEINFGGDLAASLLILCIALYGLWYSINSVFNINSIFNINI